MFQKAPLGQFILHLRGERAPKKRDCLVRVFQKLPKNAFRPVFSKFCLRAEILAKTGSFNSLLWESLKNQFDGPKKKGR